MLCLYATFLIQHGSFSLIGEHSEENPGQQDTSLNGNPVVSKRKAEEQECLDATNTNEDNNRENSHTKEGKQKRKKNKHTNKISEKEQDKPEDEVVNEEEKKDGKRKRKSSEGNVHVGHVESSLGKGVTSSAETRSEPKKKKKKKSLVDNHNRTTITESVDTVHKNGVEESVTTNRDDEDVHGEQKSDKGIIDSLISEGDSSALNGDLRLSTENDDQTLTSTVESKVLRKAAYHNGEPFAKFQKNSTPPAFVRRCLAKTSSTEPRKSKTSNKKVRT